MMNCLMRAIALNTFSFLDVAYTSCMSPFPAVFTLWNIRVYICSINSGNWTSNIESPVNNFFGFRAVLHILYVNPNDRHIWFQRDLDDSRLRCENNIIENVIIFKDSFDIVRQHLCVQLICKVGNSYNLEVGFQLRESWRRNLICFCIWRVLNIFFNFLEIWSMSGTVHTGVEVHRMDLEMCGLVKWSWLQLMCCTVYLPYDRNFKW